jgi:hypothetical protein
MERTSSRRQPNNQGKTNMRLKIVPLSTAIALITCVAPQLSFADTYTEANFTGAIEPGNANAQPPFSTAGFSGAPSSLITGTFIFDDNEVPGAGSGFDNVAIPSGSGFPTASFNLTITAANSNTLNFNLGNELSSAQGGLDAAVQYDNGNFNGFSYVSDFAYSGSEYQFLISGGTISIFQLVNGAPTGGQLLSAFINIGNSALTGETKFTPPAPVPLPPSLGLLVAGIAGLLLWRRKPGQNAVIHDGLGTAA